MPSTKAARRASPSQIQEPPRKDSPVSQTEAAGKSPTRPDIPKITADTEPDEKAVPEDSTDATKAAEPLAPPPKPSQNSNAEGTDKSAHTHTNFNLEPNPFEQSFGNPAADNTPGKTLLPPVASLTSPSSLLPGSTPGWSNSLRSGPLSPAMLAGPTGATDYFGDSFRGGFPTPNESSLRTGLTPGGGGSMFPVQSPNSQAIFSMLQSGGATPNTLDFQRAALSAASKTNRAINKQAGEAADTADDTKTSPTIKKPGRSDEQANAYHDANDAANGLFMLAQANGARNNSGSSVNSKLENGKSSIKSEGESSGVQFAVPAPPSQTANPSAPNSVGSQSQGTSPTTQRATRNTMSAGHGEGTAEMSDSGQSEQAKRTTRSRGKKGGATKAAGGNRRKADDTPSKPPAGKKTKTMPFDMPEEDDYSDIEANLKAEAEGGRKMTDEEKRKNFLERNRVAALKCRQRKKQWLQSLQAKVEYYSTENETLGQQVASLREEILNLKTLIIAHKDCPITQQQGLSGMALANLLGDFSTAHHGHPYGIAMQNGMPNGMQPQGFSMAPPQPTAPMHRS